MALAYKPHSDLPTGYEDALYTHTTVKFSLKDKLKILLGYKVELRTQTYCEHAPGNTANGETRLSVYRERALPKGWGYVAVNTSVSKSDSPEQPTPPLC